MTGLGEAFAQLLAALDRLEVRYLVGGSVASGIHGLPRQTNDIDVLARLEAQSAADLAEILQQDFYADPESARQAVAAGRAFNVIHLRHAFKFDIFPVSNPFDESQIARRRWARSPLPGLEQLEFPVASPEDVVLAKLVWFRRGGEVSERQWHDILGILSVQRGRLDRDYLEKWAALLHVTDLLSRALPPPPGAL